MLSQSIQSTLTTLTIPTVQAGVATIHKDGGFHITLAAQFGIRRELATIGII